MADAVTTRIAVFRAEKLNSNGESHKKCEIVQEFEELLGKPKALAFLLDLVGDPEEYDMARLEALKILQVWEPPTDTARARVGRRLAEVLPGEEDVLVQQWVAIAAANFVGVPAVFAAVSEMLANPDADLDVRHNCLAAVQQFGASEQAASVLRPLATDAQFGVHVRRILREWDRKA